MTTFLNLQDVNSNRPGQAEVLQQTHHLKGNQPVLLNHSDRCWFVRSGAMNVFKVAVVDGEAVGARQFLFRVQMGELLMGSSLVDSPDLNSDRPYPNAQYCVMAVAIEETELLTISMDIVARQVLAGREDFTQCLETWFSHWADALSLVGDPSIRVQAQHRQSLTLTQGQSFQPLTAALTWVNIDSGTALWMGQPDFDLTELTLLPFCDRLWLEATHTLEMSLLETTQLEDEATIFQGLDYFHRYALGCLNRLEQQQTERAFEQFQQRHVLNRQVTQAALDDLASILQPPEELIPAVEGDPLLVAAGAVGRAMDIVIHPPARSEELSRVKDPLEAIARSSRFRMRSVLLTDGWWKRNNGPLLAYTHDRLPVALLPTAKGHYELFNPVSYRRGAVNEAIAAEIAPEAFMFYRPLVGKIKQPLDLLAFSLKGHEWDLVWLLLTGLIATLLGMMVPQATAILIDSAIPDSDLGLLWQVGIMLFAVAIGQAAFQLSRGLISLKIETSADATLQPAVWDNLLSLKPSFFRTYSSGDVQSRVLSVGNIRRQISGATLQTIFSSVFALLNLGLMFAYSWPLAIIACGLALVAIVVTISSSLLTLKSIRPMQQMDGDLLGLTVQLINGVAKLRVAAAEERAFAHWGKTYSKQQKLMVRVQRIDDSVAVFNELLPTISAVLLFWFAVLVQQSSPGSVTLSAGMFLAFNSAFGIFISGATDLSNTLINILNIVPLWERAQSIIQAEPEVDPSQTDPGRLSGRLSLDHVTFRYRDDGPLILDDVTIEAEPGEFIAFVGPSGSGKSTVFRLLLGFETPASGTVYYDGQDLAGSDVNAIRRQLGVVLQNGRISSGSIFDIITGGALVTMDESWEAARNAGFAADIQQMPMGMHTVISEGGTNLSGGQRQRLLIARSLVLKPKIILMDEATSALDNNTQAIITNSLSHMNATRVVIAHRLSTIRDADRIYVLANGRVQQVGSFDELVQQEGLFARLAARQLE